VWGDIHQLISKINRVIIFLAINLLKIKTEGFIPTSVDPLSIKVYFNFLASFKTKIFYLARAREGTCKYIFKNWDLTQGI